MKGKPKSWLPRKLSAVIGKLAKAPIPNPVHRNERLFSVMIPLLTVKFGEDPLWGFSDGSSLIERNE
jgi:hypothetical protein